MEIIGLIPAAGKARRISPLPCSKELYPIGFRFLENKRSLRPKVVSHFLLDKMRKANILKSYIIIRDGKWDIPAYFGDGRKIVDMHLAYLLMDLPFGVPFTIDQAHPFVQHSMIAFGFPDIIFEPDDAFIQLIDKQRASGADLVIGLLPAPEPQCVDMVDVDLHGRVRAIQKKTSRTDLHYTWVIALWTPVFMDFLHQYVANAKKEIKQREIDNYQPGVREVTMGEVIQIALSAGLQIESVKFPEHSCLDIGTAENLIKAQRTSE